MESITAKLRVTNLNIKPFTYGLEHEGECLELRASGTWSDSQDQFPISLHFTVFPGCGVAPMVGDHVVVTIAREDSRRQAIEALVGGQSL